MVYVKAKDAVDQRESLERHLKHLRQAEEILSDAVKKIQVSITGQECCKSSMLLKIKESFHHFHDILDQREQQLLQEVECKITNEVKNLGKQTDTISTASSRVKALLNTNLSHFPPDEVLDKFTKIEKKIKEEKRKYSKIDKGVNLAEEEGVELSCTDDFSKLCQKVELIKLPINRKKTRTIKVATWNLEAFTDDKEKAESVLGVICTTIIRNG